MSVDPEPLQCQDCGRFHSNALEAAHCQRRLHDRAHSRFNASFDDCPAKFCQIAYYAIRRNLEVEK